MKLILILFSLIAATSAFADELLLSLTATPVNREVKLAWSVTTTGETIRYDILRNDIRASQTVASRATGDLDYVWVDREVQNDFDYTYTLIAVFADGSRQILGTVNGRPAYDNYAVRDYALHQNFPNPFNPTTTISVDLADAGWTTLRVFNVLGQEVGRPLNQHLPRGRHNVVFDGSRLASGVYVYQMDVNGFTAHNKMILMK